MFSGRKTSFLYKFLYEERAEKGSSDQLLAADKGEFSEAVREAAKAKRVCKYLHRNRSCFMNKQTQRSTWQAKEKPT